MGGSNSDKGSIEPIFLENHVWLQPGDEAKLAEAARSLIPQVEKDVWFLLRAAGTRRDDDGRIEHLNLWMIRQKAIPEGTVVDVPAEEGSEGKPRRGWLIPGDYDGPMPDRFPVIQSAADWGWHAGNAEYALIHGQLIEREIQHLVLSSDYDPLVRLSNGLDADMCPCEAWPSRTPKPGDGWKYALLEYHHAMKDRMLLYEYTAGGIATLLGTDIDLPPEELPRLVHCGPRLTGERSVAIELWEIPQAMTSDEFLELRRRAIDEGPYADEAERNLMGKYGEPILRVYERSPILAVSDDSPPIIDLDRSGFVPADAPEPASSTDQTR